MDRIEADKMLKLNLKIHKLEEENKSLKQENHNLKEQLENFIPRRRVRRVYKMLGKILKQDGIVDDLLDLEEEQEKN